MAHKDQTQKNLESLFWPIPRPVALILAEQNLNSVTIAAGLLHDVLKIQP